MALLQATQCQAAESEVLSEPTKKVRRPLSLSTRPWFHLEQSASRFLGDSKMSRYVKICQDMSRYVKLQKRPRKLPVPPHHWEAAGLCA